MTASGSSRAEFQGIELEQLPDDRCRARVSLGRKLGARLRQSFVGKAEAEWSPMGELRCAAQAALQALERSFGAAEGTFRVLDIKTVESFDCKAVIVAIAVRHAEIPRLVGFCEVKGDPTDAAARAALNGTNRFVSYYLA